MNRPPMPTWFNDWSLDPDLPRYNADMPLQMRITTTKLKCWCLSKLISILLLTAISLAESRFLVNVNVVNAFARWHYVSRLVHQRCLRSRGNGNWKFIRRVSRRLAKTAAWFSTPTSSWTTRGPSSSSCRWSTTSAVWWQLLVARISARTATLRIRRWKRSWASQTCRHRTRHISSTIVSSCKLHWGRLTKTSLLVVTFTSRRRVFRVIGQQSYIR